MVDAALGSIEDRRTLQQSLTSLRVATSHRDAMNILETWGSNMKRARDMDLEMPDSQVMLHAVNTSVSRMVEISRELEYRVQVYLV